MGKLDHLPEMRAMIHQMVGQALGDIVSTLGSSRHQIIYDRQTFFYQLNCLIKMLQL